MVFCNAYTISSAAGIPNPANDDGQSQGHRAYPEDQKRDQWEG